MHSYWPVFGLVLVAAFVLGSVRLFANMMGWIDDTGGQ